MLTQHVSKGLLWLNFKIKQDYIAAVLCENKDNPNSDCDGKCYLRKKMKDQSKKEQSALESRHETYVVDYATLLQPQPILYIVEKAMMPTYLPYDESLIKGMHFDILQPPDANV